MVKMDRNHKYLIVQNSSKGSEQYCGFRLWVNLSCICMSNVHINECDDGEMAIKLHCIRHKRPKRCGILRFSTKRRVSMIQSKIITSNSSRLRRIHMNVVESGACKPERALEISCRWKFSNHFTF